MSLLEMKVYQVVLIKGLNVNRSNQTIYEDCHGTTNALPKQQHFSLDPVIEVLQRHWVAAKNEHIQKSKTFSHFESEG